MTDYVSICCVCRRPLRSSASRALGIGPKCARRGHTRAAMQTRTRSLTTETMAGYKLYRLLTTPLTLNQFRAELAGMARPGGRAGERGTKKMLARMRAEMLRARKTFCAGVFQLDQGQCVFEPAGEDLWREVHSSWLMGTPELAAYLNQIGVLTPEHPRSFGESRMGQDDNGRGGAAV